ncbi:MAG TPA: aminotransferase class I/II-fold pyridoxal phosphate-dependent enzyme [Actinomycetota bacterium]|nr:aminotransferase class I/II-fold pyridoxal phosphate-dependent enzyme [Actinomycetota bacterium]
MTHGFTTRSLRWGPDEGRRDLGPAEPVAVPIYQASTFAFPCAEELAEIIRSGHDAGYVYSRWHNPTRAALESVVADLEGAGAAVSFSSGMAAITTSLAAVARSGDHVVFSPDLYGGSFAVARKILPRWGVRTTIAGSHRAEDFVAAMEDGTVACFAETIGNPTVSVPDLSALGAECRSRGVRLVVDNTFASPYLCNPLSLGADIVAHSTTKYLGGHHDLIGGVACGSRELMDEVREMSVDLGGTASPFDAWLALRGTATLALRMERHCSNALQVAGYLEGHPKVARVWYPGLPSHPDHRTAMSMLRGFGGMLAFELADGLDAGRRFTEGVRLAKMAPSLGGVHTLVIHAASVTHTQLTPEERASAGIGEGLVRVSVGIEDPEDLLHDFEQALKSA